MRRTRGLCVVLVAGCGLAVFGAASAEASLIAYEGFFAPEYVVGQSVIGLDSAVPGFTGAWMVRHQGAIADSPLVYTTPGGQTLASSGFHFVGRIEPSALLNADHAVRQFDLSPGSPWEAAGFVGQGGKIGGNISPEAPLYMSVTMVNREDAAGAMNTTRLSFVGFHDGFQAMHEATELYFGTVAGDGRIANQTGPGLSIAGRKNLDVAGSNWAAEQQVGVDQAAMDAVFGTPHLLVLKVEFGAGLDGDFHKLTLWFNPDTLGGAEPAGGLVVTDKIPATAQFDHIALVTNEYSGNISRFADLRFGTTYAAVTPLAGPDFILGDFNGDGVLSGLDIPGFKTALADPDGWAAANPSRPHPNQLGDFNTDSVFSGLDIPGFKTALAGGATAIPEPATMLVALTAALWTLKRRHRA